MLRVLGLLALFFSPYVAHATVAIGNGNYFIGFVDLEHSAPADAFQLKVERTYNSRSQFDGVFGYGWGTGFEAFLVPSADGSVVIQESGGGDKTRFSPKEYSQGQLNKSIEKILEAYQKKKGVPASAVGYVRQRILNDANERDEMARDLGVPADLPEGTLLYSTQRGAKQVVKVLKNGFVRQYNDGKQEFFTVRTKVFDHGVDVNHRRELNGVYKVSELVDPIKKAKVLYKYDGNGQLTTVTDGGSQTIRYRYESRKIVEASDTSGKRASYRYCKASSGYNSSLKCGAGDLVWSKDTSNSEYTYQYDSLHNLTRIGYPGKKAEEITYWDTSGQGGVKSVKDITGRVSEYSYWQDPSDKDEHYKTTVKTTYSSGRSSEAAYEYFEKKRADGSRYRYKLVAKTDGEETTTIYNECCGQPIQITSSEGVTHFEYYPNTGLPKEKDSPTENIAWEYHDKFRGKITKVTVTDKARKTATSSKFEYDAQNGRLIKAQTSDGKGIVLQYDNRGRIARMIDQDKRRISFQYNALSKPAVIVQEGVGSIEVSYDPSGNIKDVKSKGGREIAVSVAGAFQNLLDIIKPAGIQPI